MLIIPTQPIPNQILTSQINGQQTQLNIYQLSTGLYMDVYLNNVLITGGVLCHNLNVVVRWQYLGYVGDFSFVDQQALTDPFYTGLGSRYLLFYFFPNELPRNLF
jgi:hypothetical protein